MTRTFRTPARGWLFLTVLTLTILPARDVRSQDTKPGDKASPLEGAWRLVEQKNGDAQQYQKLPEGTEMIKYVTGGRFVWTVVQEGKITAALGGKYKVDKDKYTETIEYYHGDGQASLVGKSFDFTWKVDENAWLHSGVIKVADQDVKIDEKWERCK
jgi:TRAP-type mannitol/chloroaromatic compound transport system substrate-binding protein